MTEDKDVLALEDTEISTWFERDRAHVALYDKKDEARNKPILEYWDDEVAEAIEDGFLNPRDYHRSAYKHARDMGILPEESRPVRIATNNGMVIVHEEKGVLVSWAYGELIWSGELSPDDVTKRGAYVFSDEENAKEILVDDPQEIDDEEAEFMSQCEFLEVEKDHALETGGNLIRCSVAQLEKMGINLQLSTSPKP